MIDFKKLTDKQKEARKILEANEKTEILFDGGSRAGKTFLIIMWCIYLCLRYQGIRILIARLRFAHVKASVWMQTMTPMLSSCFKGVDYVENKTDWIIKIGQNEIWLGGILLVPTRPSMRKPPAGRMKAWRSVSDFSVTARVALTRPCATCTT